MFRFSDRSLQRMEHVNPQLQLIFKEAIAISPIDFGLPPHAGVRNAAEQHELYKANKSECDGYLKISKHQLAEALDFYAYVGGKASWSIHHLAMVAGVLLTTARHLKRQGKTTIDLRWGGTFNSTTFDGWDPGHIEIVR